MGKNRREEAVENALIRNYDKFYRLAYSYTRNEADAMDIVQEGAYKAILRSDSLRNKDYAETWIYRIMLNEVFTFLRKRRETADLEEIEAAGEDSYGNIDLRNAIAGLEPRDRAVVTLRYFEDRKLDEIARILNENLSTVKSRLYRVMGKLKLALGD